MSCGGFPYSHGNQNEGSFALAREHHVDVAPYRAMDMGPNPHVPSLLAPSLNYKGFRYLVMDKLRD